MLYGSYYPDNSRIVDYKMNIERLLYRGIGLIYYPYPQFQISTTLGIVSSNYSRIIIPDNSLYYSGEIGSGIGADILVAYDTPINNVGFQIGCRYFSSGDILYVRVSCDSVTPSYVPRSLGLFVKIRY